MRSALCCCIALLYMFENAMCLMTVLEKWIRAGCWFCRALQEFMALSRQISYLQATSETAKDAYLANKCPLEDTKLREEWKKLVESQNRLLVAWQALAINMPAGAGEPPYRHSLRHSTST